MLPILAQIASTTADTNAAEAADAVAATTTDTELPSQALAEIIVQSNNHGEFVERASNFFTSHVQDPMTWLEQIETFVVDYTLRTIGALITFAIGWMLARWISQRVKKWFTRSKHVEITVANYIETLTRTAILLITIIAVLGKFGVQTASIVGVISAASLAIGLALQGTLSNFAAGVMLMVFRPFREGDEVEIAGHEGVIATIGVFATEVTAYSGEFVLIPNSEVWGKTIRNLTRNGSRRFEITVELAHSNNHDTAIERIRAIMEADEKVLGFPEPFITLTQISSSGFVINARAWTSPAVISSTRSRIIGAIRKDFQVLGISYPSSELYVIDGPAPAGTPAPAGNQAPTETPRPAGNDDEP